MESWLDATIIASSIRGIADNSEISCGIQLQELMLALRITKCMLMTHHWAVFHRGVVRMALSAVSEKYCCMVEPDTECPPMTDVDVGCCGKAQKQAANQQSPIDFGISISI